MGSIKSYRYKMEFKDKVEKRFFEKFGFKFSKNPKIEKNQREQFLNKSISSITNKDIIKIRQKINCSDSFIR